MLLEYLINNYQKGEPIFLSDINIEDISQDSIRYHMKKLTKDGVICRFDSGIYYLPKLNIFGEQSMLSSETVAMHKYVSRRGKRIGFYSGYTLANRLGLSTQVPFKEEITSNNAPAQVREITIKNRKYVIRRPVVEVSEDNVYILQFLDCLKDIDKSAEVDLMACGIILSEYTRKHGITRQQVDQFVNYYPLKIYKAIYETGIIKSI